ncbi:DNA polymerase, partial [Archaeoglobales archaeon]
VEKEVPLKIMSFDIEMAEEDGKEKIIMISYVTNYGKKGLLTTKDWEGRSEWVEVLSSEGEMIKRFFEILQQEKPDFLVGYNSDSFDFAKIRERSEALGIKFEVGREKGKKLKTVRRGRIPSTKIIGIVHIDLYDFIDHILSPTLKSEVLTLDAVAQELLGLKKLDVKWKEIEKAWKEGTHHLQRVAEYCLWDSELTLKLAEELLPQIFAISRLTGLPPFDVARFTYSQLDEAYLMRKAVEQNVIIENNPKQEDIRIRRMKPSYTGGFVLEPKRGIHTDIVVFDFRSLYPTIIITHNISPDTIDCKHEECRTNRPPNFDHHFCTKKKGFIPRNLEDVIRRRVEIKQKMKSFQKGSAEYKSLYNMQYALKIIANAMYGYMGYVGARWYCYACAAATAAFGRHYIKKSIEIAKEEGCEIIYGDTDSLFVRIPSVGKERLKETSLNLLQKINSQLPGIIELEFRGNYEAGIFVTVKGEKRGAKKRYALIDKEGNLEIRGFETVRRDWCELAKWVQHEVLRIILQERDINKALKLVRDTIKRIRDGKATKDELTIYTQLTMPLNAYRAIGPHVKAAMKLKQMGEPVGEGMVVSYIITKGAGSISDRAMPADFVGEGEYDPEYYVNHQVLPAAMRVLQALGYSEKEVMAGESQKSLDVWFKKS